MSLTRSQRLGVFLFIAVLLGREGSWDTVNWWVTFGLGLLAAYLLTDADRP